MSDVIRGLDLVAARAPSLLPGWTRAHVLSHLARMADGLVNMLEGAKLGEVRQLYSSRDDRDAAIEDGAARQLSELEADVATTSRRFVTVADTLTDDQWGATLAGPLGVVDVSILPWGRCVEVYVHLVDLDVGISYDDVVDLAGESVRPLLEYAAWRASATGAPSMRVEPFGRWFALLTSDGREPPIRRSAGDMLRWLTGRSRADDSPDWTMPRWS
jgi:maleylpyruvate isomerase